MTDVTNETENKTALLEKNHQKDPYSDYASCPDTLRAYIEYSNQNQARWIEESQKTIRTFIQHLDQFKNFLEAYTCLAEKRHQIAVLLKQRSDEGRTDYYGAFRQEGDHFRQSISEGDGEQFWKWQKKKVFDLAYKLIAPAKERDVIDETTGYVYEDKYLGCLKEKVVVDDKKATYYCASIKSQSDENIIQNEDRSTILSQVELFDYDKNKSANLIRIIYTPVNQRKMIGNYKIADHYYQALLKWQSKDGLQAFLENAAKLAYLIAHLLPVKQGNAGIMEWMLRGIAYKKGIDLGHFNHEDGISWDFKAVLTADRDAYIKWFCAHAFKNCRELSKAETAQEFTFKKS